MTDAEEMPTGVASLHGLVRTDRHRLDVRAATSAEIEAISGELHGCAPVGGHIAVWRVAGVRDHATDKTTLHFLGRHKNAYPWISGRITALTCDRVLARAGGLVYGLGDESVGEWSPEALIEAMTALRGVDARQFGGIPATTAPGAGNA